MRNRNFAMVADLIYNISNISSNKPTAISFNKAIAEKWGL